MRLRSKMLMVWGGFVLALWAATLWPVQRTLEANFSRLSIQAFDGTRQGLSAMQDERVKRMRQASTLVMNIPELRALIAEHNYELAPANLTSLEERLDSLAKTLGAGFVCVLDNRGNVIAQNRESPWPNVPELQKYITRHVEAAALVHAIYAPNSAAGDVYGLWSTDTGLMQAVGAPLVFGEEDDGSGAPPTPDGALLIATPITNELASELASSDGCQLTFFTGQHVAATSISDARLRDQLPSLLSLHRGEQTVFSGIPYRVYSEPLRDPCSSAVVGEMLIQSNQSDAEAVRKEVSYTLLAILGGGLILMVVGSYILSGAITRPIGQLLTGVKRVGKGDLSLSLPAKRKDELGELAVAFNDMVRQIATRQELERQMEETKSTSRAKSLFLANMSHEIRTPLNGVIGMADLLMGTELTERQRRYAGLVKSSAEVLTTLVNDTLDFAKIEAGKMELESIDFDLHTVVEEVVEMFAPKAHQKGLAIVCDIGDKVRRASRGDPNRLRQIVINLLNNAIKFTDQGEIVVRAALDPADSSLVRISISDTGIGIAPERLDRLFKAFSQVDTSTTRRFGGTGLGLVICKQLAELMGGNIGVQSEEGEGSTFWFTARIVAAEQLQLPSLSDPRWSGMKVLLAEGAKTQREVLAARLAEWGFDVVAVATEAELSARMGDSAFQLAIVGQMGDEGSAIKIAKMTAAKVPSLVLLRSDQEIAPTQLREAKLRGYITQPLRQMQLARAIVTALSPAEAKQGTVMKAAASAPVARSSMRILLADDHDVNQLVVVDILDQAGFTCEVVSDGLQACQAAEQQKFDLILMDCQMPEMDGFEATREIRRREKLAGSTRVPIVALTANADGQDRQRCLDAGMDEFCTKPIDRNRLLSMVQSMSPAAKLPASPSVATQPIAPVQASEPAPSSVLPPPNAPPPASVSAPPRAPSSPSAPAPINLETLLRRCSGKSALAEKVLGKFTTQAEAALAGIASSLASGDAAAIARLAHGLKGAAGMTSADQVQAIAGKLETLGKSADLQPVAAAVDQLKAEIAHCIQFIAQSAKLDLQTPAVSSTKPSSSTLDRGA